MRSLAADVEPAPQPRGLGPEKLGGGPRSRDAEASVLSSSPSEVYALDWPRTLLERYEVGKEIGRGSFGVVRLVAPARRFVERLLDPEVVGRADAIGRGVR